jgi:DNA replication protein DnaC
MAEANCPHCGGTGWKILEVEGLPNYQRSAVRCECSAESPTRIFEHARVPRRYRQCDFENFDLDLAYEDEPEGRPWDESLKRAKLEVQGFVRNYPTATGRGLLLMGPCGVGKTHLAVAALKELLLRGHEGLFYDYRELLKEIQASYNPVSQATEMGVLEPVLKTELLVVDDLGASKPSAWALETVGHILNTRYNEERVTLITTNYLDRETAQRPALRLPSGEALVRADDTFADRVGQRIRSRLYEMCRTVEIVSRDYRRVARHVRS